MQTMRCTRRRFLLGSAVLGMGGASLGASNALAFSAEQVDAETEALAMGACQASGAGASFHERLLTEIVAALQGKSTAEIQAQIAGATCPLCGCALG